MRKKKQEMLKTQIECQKVMLPITIFFPPFSHLHFLIIVMHLFQALINRLEKNRGMKPEERANIMKTLKELTEKITQLQNEMSLIPASQASHTKPNHSQPKTKTDVGLQTSESSLSVQTWRWTRLMCVSVCPGAERAAGCRTRLSQEDEHW